MKKQNFLAGPPPGSGSFLVILKITEAMVESERAWMERREQRMAFNCGNRSTLLPEQIDVCTHHYISL